MNKTAIKNFSIWARRKLIEDISNKARLVGISEKGINDPLPSSTEKVQFFDVGTREPYSISGVSIGQREVLVKEIQRRALDSDHKTAYTNLVEEVAYTWFNRLIAIRFMEVNNYLLSRIRVLSSEADNKLEPDIVTSPFSAALDYSDEERQTILQLKHSNKLDSLFRILFIKQCNSLNDNLPELFEKINDYTELLLQISFTDKEGVIYHLVNDIDEDDFNVEKEGQVEIIGWLYQFYNTEPKDETFKLLKNNVKITKERIPSATQLFTPDWIVRYMVENSLGRLWVEGHPNEELKKNWKYYLEEAEQQLEVQKHLEKIRREYSALKPEDIKIIDPAMGSGHILVYAFDVLIQIYTSQGYSQRDAAKLILENNLFGLDIDKRAYQIAYFAILMKARQYNRRILENSIKPNLCHFEESNRVKRNHLKFFGASLSDLERNSAKLQIEGLIDTFIDAKELGSIINVESYDWTLLRRYLSMTNDNGQLSVETIGIEETKGILDKLIDLGEVMAGKYDIVVTNPPYMGNKGMSGKLSEYVKKNYPDSKSDLFAVFIEKCSDMISNNSLQAMITQHAWMFLSSFEKLRAKVLGGSLLNMVHLGSRAFDEIGGEVVQTTTFIIRKRLIDNYKTSFIRLTDYSSQDLKSQQFNNKKNFYIQQVANFSKISGTPIAYWASKNIFKAFERNKILGEIASPRQGLATGDNDRFIRMWYEIEIDNANFSAADQIEADKSKKKWFPYNKGGQFRKWYGNNDYLVNWENSGFEIRNFKDDWGNLRSRPQNINHYYKPSITWSKISSGSIAFRYKPKGHIFDVAGTSIFATDELMRYLLGFCNSKVALEIANIISPTLNYEVGHISSFPIIIDTNMKSEIETLVSHNIQLSTFDWDSFETSWDFNTHPLLRNINIESAYYEIKEEYEKRFTNLKSNEEKINRIFIDIYGLQDELKPDIEDRDITVSRIYDTKKDIPESMRGNSFILTKQDIVKSLISYAAGCIFGRYSLDIEGLAYVGGDWDNSKYKSFFPDKDNVIPITDEEYFNDDIVGLFISFVKKVYGDDTLERNLSFIANALGNSGDSPREIIRNYFLNDFFEDHVKTYKSRPIYWLFDSGKQNGFKALVYLHRYTEDTIGKLRVDYLHRLQKVYENEIARMQKTIDESSDSREISKATKRQEKLIKQLQETMEYDEKITHLALEKITLDLDDGVKANYEKIQTDREGRKHQVLAKI